MGKYILKSEVLSALDCYVIDSIWNFSGDREIRAEQERTNDKMKEVIEDINDLDVIDVGD